MIPASSSTRGDLAGIAFRAACSCHCENLTRRKWPDPEFGPTLLPLLRRLQRPRQQARGRRTQCILAGASWPPSSRDDSAAISGERRRRAGASQPLLRSLLSEELASAVRVRSRGLHRLPPRLALECVAVSAQSKTEALLAALHRTVAQQQEQLASEKEAGAAAEAAACVMVFANTNASAVFVSAFLREALADGRLDREGAADWTIAAVHGHLGPAEREAVRRPWRALWRPV